jgi:hypothetical protein
MVTTPRVHLDPDASLGPVEKLREPLEDQLTSALQAAADEVDEEYAGEQVAEVGAKLLAATKAGLHDDIAAGFAPDPAQVHSIAQTIVDENR